MFEYIICNQADKDIFLRQCKAIEKHLSPLEKEPLLVDVDSSEIQRYNFNGSEVIVINSIYQNEVIVKSDIDIKPYF